MNKLINAIKKNRIFVTNSLSFLPECDEIIMLENGYITAHGKYDNLIKTNEIFIKFISNYFQTFDNSTKGAEQASGEQMSTNMYVRNRNKKSSTIRRRQVSLINVPTDYVDEFKIIESEKIASGNVKLTRLVEFFRASSFNLVLLHFSTYILLHVTIAVNNFWLANWSNEAEKELGDNNKKLERILVFIGIGILFYLQHRNGMW